MMQKEFSFPDRSFSQYGLSKPLFLLVQDNVIT